jgi:hypothetical protein
MYKLFIPPPNTAAMPKVVYKHSDFEPFLLGSLSMAVTDHLTAYTKRIQRRDKLISFVTRSLTPLRYSFAT